MKWSTEKDTLELEAADFEATGRPSNLNIHDVNRLLKEWFDYQSRVYGPDHEPGRFDYWKDDMVTEPYKRVAILTGIKPIAPMKAEQALSDLLSVISLAEFEHGERFTVGINDQGRARKAIEQARKVLAK